MDPSVPPSPDRPVTVRAIALDFANKVERELMIDEATVALAQGESIWVDARVDHLEGALAALLRLGLVPEDILTDALEGEPLTRLARFEDCIHLVVSGCRPRGSAFDLERDAARGRGKALLGMEHGESTINNMPLPASPPAYGATWPRARPPLAAGA